MAETTPMNRNDSGPSPDPGQSRSGRIVSIVWLVVAGVMLIAGVFLVIRSNHEQAAIQQEIDRKHLLTPVDFSVAGVTRVPLFPKQNYGHSPSLQIEISGPPVDPDSLDDLKGSFALLDKNGNVVEQTPIMPSCFDAQGHAGVPLARIEFALREKYLLQLDVREPATALRGRSQYLFFSYHACGFEFTSCALMRLAGLGSGLTGLFVAAATVRMLRGAAAQ